MEQQFDATLTGTDSEIDGTVQQVIRPGYSEAYDFRSIDGTLHLLIGKDRDGEWIRISGTEPYLSSWIDELAEQAASHSL
ncbi:hypothetical protein SAMN05192574_101274 [Mucilaginibacter gossypiicola]|uniref:Uncharacterized protein n=1 Tax=Mucilaginibacter gossypiicola TaxID=551995 RepID=A0A1H8A2A7_9SPHI|nr:hypothetical protein [Mucilaginibacter gossypiicola]SEM63687.1 hypothetical protein SAMN05192574_101274 [Mucilaginibacter gossypiicola]